MTWRFHFPLRNYDFKRKHGTVCVFTLKELIRYYIKHGSCMYVAYLDASKAFDRVNQDNLFKTLLNNGVPKWIIQVIILANGIIIIHFVSSGDQ